MTFVRTPKDGKSSPLAGISVRAVRTLLSPKDVAAANTALGSSIAGFADLVSIAVLVGWIVLVGRVVLAA